jgi:O-antigen ligase
VDIQKQRAIFEGVLVFAVTIFFGFAISFLGALALKFQIAFAAGFFALLAICLFPARRTLCLCLWVLIYPLSIEKILYTAPPLWPSLRGMEIVLNAGDVILFILFVVLVVEKITLRQTLLIWDNKAKILTGLVVWAIFSHLFHVLFYHSSFVESGQLGVLHLLRNLLFVMIIGAAMKTRADLIWVMITIIFVLIIQSILVSLSFATGEAFNFSRLLGLPTALQKYSVGGEQIARGAGTLGVPNQQAMFHAMFTFLMLGLLPAKNALIRLLAIIAILASLVSVIFTFSRSAWFGIGVATMIIVCLFIKRREITPKAWLMGGLLAIFFVSVLGVLAEPIINRLTQGDDGATDSRVRMIQLAKDLIVQYPLIGVGPSEFVEAGLHLYPPGQKETEWVPLGGKAIVPPLGRIELSTSIIGNEKPVIVPLPVHNKYLLVFSELGLVGLMIWLALFKNFYSEAVMCSQSKDLLFRYIGVAGIGIVVIGLLYQMLDLFADDKTLQVLLFPLIFISSAARLSKQSAIINH